MGTTTARSVVGHYNSLENPIGIETAVDKHSADRVVGELQLIRKPIGIETKSTAVLSSRPVADYNSLENP